MEKKRKEIENYFLNSGVIYRHIKKNCSSKKIELDVIETKLYKIIESQENMIFDAIAQHFYNKNKGTGITNANKHARSIVHKIWLTDEGKLTLCSGKEVISQMSGWSHSEYGVSFNAKSLAREMTLHDIPQEMKNVIVCLEKNEFFHETQPN